LELKVVPVTDASSEVNLPDVPARKKSEIFATRLSGSSKLPEIAIELSCGTSVAGECLIATEAGGFSAGFTLPGFPSSTHCFLNLTKGSLKRGDSFLPSSKSSSSE
jgi:hypothetical protein